MTNPDPRGSSATLSALQGAAGPSSAAQLRLEELLRPFTPDKPGLAVLVTQAGETVFERYLGVADLEHGAPVSASTGFHIASVSKQFTAFAALLEAAAGRLDLTADIRAYLPEAPDFGATITVADLVHHTSGLRDVADLLGLSGTDLGGVIRQGATVALVLRQRELNFPPGTRHHYSNSGYTLLAEIVGRTCGRRLARYLDAEVFAPLGMADSLVWDNDGKLLPGEAKSYRLNSRGEPRRLPMNNSCYGPRGVYTTARDLAKWGRELLRPAVFPREVIARAIGPGRLRDGSAINYGFGLHCGTLGDRRVLAHHGGDNGYRAVLMCFPDDDATVVVLSNGQADVGAIGDALAVAFLGVTLPAPVSPEPRQLAELEGYYVWGGGPGLTLRVSDGRLTASSAGPAVDVKFLPDGGFYLYSPSSRWSRTPDGDLIETTGLFGSPLTHRRRLRVKPSAAALVAIAGTYRSEELDSTYELTATDGGLTLSALRFPQLTFSPAEEDAFDSPEFRIAIVRDAAGAPTGLRVSTWGSWGLWFRKVG